MMWLILLALVAICCYVYIKIKNWYNYWDRQGIKNVKPKSFLHLFGIQKDKSMHDVVRDMYNTFEERYFGMFNITPVLMIKDLELIKKITVKEFDSFQNHRQFAPSGVDPLWSKNVFDANGEEWKELRSVLSPSFTSSKMRGMFNLMQECAKAFTDYFLEQKKEVIDVEFKDIFSKYTNDVIATSAFGIRCNSLKEPKNTFFQMGKEAFDFSGLRFFKFFIFSVCPPIILKTLRLRLFPKRIAKFFKSIIQDTIKTREENNIIRPDMIHLLMQARKGIETKDEGFKGDVKEFSSVNEYNLGKSNSNKKIELTIDSIVSQAFIFFFGGFDTSSTAMSLIAYELAVDQDIQKRLREEIDRTYEECRGELTYEVLLNMKYLDMVVSETLRKWPPAPFMDRLTTKDFVIEPEKPTEKPVLVKKGSLVWIPVAGLHYDPKYFPNPTKFDPERFSDENKHNIIPTSYLPFGNGPRNCIGSRFALMTVKCVVFNLLRNFELVPTAKSQIPVKIKNTSLAIAAENGFNFGLKRRM